MLTRQQLPSRLRCVLVAGAATGGAAVVGRWLAETLTERLTARSAEGTAGPVTTVEEALVRVCTVGLLLAVGWAWVATVCVVVEAWRGRPGRGPAPVPLRRVVLLCCGVALAAPAGPAAADDRPVPPALVGLPLPDRAEGPAHPQSPRPVPRAVVVRTGDSLWRLAAADLPPDASDADVTGRWHTIHRLNRAVIGPDPDLIHPGQRLVLPPPPARPRR